MKYPDYPTQTQPVRGEDAKKLLAILDAGGAITNDRAQKTFKRIVDRNRRRLNKDGETGEIPQHETQSLRNPPGCHPRRIKYHG